MRGTQPAIPLEDAKKFLADVQKAISICSTYAYVNNACLAFLLAGVIPWSPCVVGKLIWDIVAMDNEVTDKEAVFLFGLPGLTFVGLTALIFNYVLPASIKDIKETKLSLFPLYVIPHLNRLTSTPDIPASLFSMRDINAEKCSFIGLLETLNQAKETLEKIIKAHESEKQQIERDKRSLSCLQQVWSAAARQASHLCFWRKTEEKHATTSPQLSA